MQNHDCKKEFEDIYWKQFKNSVPQKFTGLQAALELSIGVAFGLGGESVIRNASLKGKYAFAVGAVFSFIGSGLNYFIASQNGDPSKEHYGDNITVTVH